MLGQLSALMLICHGDTRDIGGTAPANASGSGRLSSGSQSSEPRRRGEREAGRHLADTSTDTHQRGPASSHRWPSYRAKLAPDPREAS